MAGPLCQELSLDKVEPWLATVSGAQPARGNPETPFPGKLL